MGKYAFCFKHNLFGNNESESFKEYFIPYVPGVLMEIVDDEEIREQLEIPHWKSFDEYVEAHNLQKEADYIQEIPDDRKSDTGWWMNDENNIDELCAWDYLADAKAVIEAERANGESTERVNSVAEETMISRIDFDYLKLLLSIMVYTDGPDPDGILNGNEPPNDFGPGIKEKILEIHRIIRDIKLGEIPFDNFENSIKEYIKRIEDVGRGDEKREISDLIEKIIKELEKGFSIKSLKDFENYNYKISDLSKPKNFCELLGVQYEKRYTYIYTHYRNLLRYDLVDYWYMRRSSSILDEELLTLCIDKGGVKDFIYKKDSIIIKEIVTMWNQHNMRLDIIDDFIYLPRWIKNNRSNVLDNLKGKLGKELYDKYSIFEDGCFAILVTSKNKKYFALSGAYEIHNDNNKINQIGELAKYIRQNALNNGNVPYVWAELNDNTLRYTEILDEMSKQTDKYIKFPFRYCNDKKITIKNPGLTYGCCERKIFGYLENDTIKGIYSRWAPCWKCKPAVIAALPEKFYAFAKDFNEWKNKGKTMQLKNYIITTPITFLIDE